MLTITLLAAASATAAGPSTFDYIRLGDVDGFGFQTGMAPCSGEPCWPFNSCWTFVNTDLGACSGFNLLNGSGNPINVDGLDILTQGDFLPDLDCSFASSTSYNYTYNSDEFDNREPAEIAGTPEGNYIETNGATDLGSNGSGWTDSAVSGIGLGWADCLYAPPAAPYICDYGQPGFTFDFSVPNADSSNPVYLNVVFGDYDINSTTDHVLLRSATGTEMTVSITPQGNSTTADGMIQQATATVPFSMVFSGWPASTNGYLEVKFYMPGEPMVAYDYAELSITPLVEPTGCCCYEDGTSWILVQMTEAECDNKSGYYAGDGVPCDGTESPPGACCITYDDGSVECIETVECDCDALGGVFFVYAPCIQVPCDPQEATGCCCYQVPLSGLWFLSDVTELACDGLGGHYYGDGVPCDEEMLEPGACCIGSVYCVDTVACDCEEMGGTFYTGLNCADSDVDCGGPAIPGACCFINPTTGQYDCVFVTESNCLDSGEYPLADWKGPFIPCSSYPHLQCSKPFGACCIDNTCIWTLRTACLDAAGSSWHAGQRCFEVECPSCPADVTGDGLVDISDLLEIINLWGGC